MENLLKNITYQNLTHEILNLKNIIIIKEIKFGCKKHSSTNKTQSLGDFAKKFYQLLKELIIPIITLPANRKRLIKP